MIGALVLGDVGVRNIAADHGASATPVPRQAPSPPPGDVRGWRHPAAVAVIAASNAGSDTHPAWYHNLRAHPDVTLNGTPMRATLIEEEHERQRLWSLADRVFPAFDRYRRDASTHNRTIPLIQLTERELN